MHGLQPEGEDASRVLAMRETQRNVTLLDEFRNNTLFVRTAPYAVLDGAQYGTLSHYYGRADTYFQIGKALGKGMLQMLQSSKSVDPGTQKSTNSSLRTRRFVLD